MKELFVQINKVKISILLSFLCFSFAKTQEIDFKSFIINENLRDELIIVNDYIKELKNEKLISQEPLFIRFEAGEAVIGEVLNLRFLGNYYRNVSHKEELFYKTSDNIFYIFDYQIFLLY